MKWLHEEVKKYTEDNTYPFHMPGGKRSCLLSNEIAKYDVTEIEGLDDLRNPTGIIKDLEKGWSNLYKAGSAHLLVNGSTCGNLSMIFAATQQGGTILVVGKHHWSVENAAEIRQLKVRYLQTDSYKEGFDKPANPLEIKQELDKYTDIQCVLLTSPTYEGVVSDIGAISKTVHDYGIPLIVDCAHGAHLGITEGWDDGRAKLWNTNPIACGADYVVVSLHKTLPVMGQTSLVMTSRENDFVDDERLKHYINIFQTSSPSYVLMSSASAALKLLIAKGKEKLEKLQKELNVFIQDNKDLKNLKILDYDSIELSKIIISTKKHKSNGFKTEERLRTNYSLFLEKATEDYIIAMTSINDSTEGFERLTYALHDIDREGL